ncbi:hypothetical protein COLU111180_20095 [Cohnella lubricantis]|uniref:Phosphatidylinositol kinase n=1 Tax=Cohnella lubricantis TaxID=2163172 RepID=A0A841THN7_9BACL|nr:hypothetical protein [Cohnella lubricantis]MBB6678748.1 hypothetical protein [Cohnella lubricantis]MBP2119816.1 hypothetical protein [Cohnella lubricantis]
MEKNEMKRLCEKHMHRYVELQAADGTRYDGIVEYVDEHTVCLAVPGAYPDSRAFFPGPFYPGFGYGFGSPFFRPRRFARFAFPLAALAGLSLLPYYW